MNDAVRGWLRDDDEPTLDRNRQIGRVMGRVDETRQRRRSWPLNPFGRGAVHSATGADGTVVVTGGGIAARAPMRLMTAVVLVALVTVGLLYVSARPPSLTPLPAALPVDPADEALFERMNNVWGTDSVDIATVMEGYAPDALHTVLWQDKVQRISGNFDIASRIMISENLSEKDSEQRVRLPDARDGQHRYLAVAPSAGGMPCVFWIDDGRITRHDCIVPMSEEGGWLFTPGEPPADVSREELAARVTQGWRGDRKAMEQAISTDIVHYVAWDDHDAITRGFEHYMDAASLDLPPMSPISPSVDLPAPEGELRWTDYSDLGDGTLCTFWARGGKVIRHDCITPTNVTGSGASSTP